MTLELTTYTEMMNDYSPEPIIETVLVSQSLVMRDVYLVHSFFSGVCMNCILFNRIAMCTHVGHV